MAKTELKTNTKTEIEDKSSLKGTIGIRYLSRSLYRCHLGKRLLLIS